VVGKLGSGGQADVYRAINPSLSRELVIKRSQRPCRDDPAERALLLNEARLLADLDHPNLARIYDLDFDEDRAYLVLEYVRGRTLQQYAQQERPSPRKAAALLARLARALGVAHRRGVIHLDLKPNNLMIDEAGQPRIIDFGMAHIRHAWTGEDRPGVCGGTPAYMAPEQGRGEWRQLSPQTDIFALGAVLYELLAGKAPFLGKNSAEALARSQSCDFDRAALRTARAPRALERICLKAMASAPNDRYATAEDLAADLERYVRRPRTIALVTAGAAALVLLLLGGLALWRSPSPPVPAELLSVDALEVVQYGKRDGKKWSRVGTIGKTSHAAQFPDDSVRVNVRLNEPAYCYLIAFNPDGKEQLCYPANATSAPARVQELQYPAGFYFGLSDGVGLQVFVVVASRRPLPAFTHWKAEALPWQSVQTDGSWRWRNGQVDILGSDRGELRTLGQPAALGDLCQRLKGMPGVDAVMALAFPVRGKEAGK
jgi:tRNA A-37 threonylcarbamoyl transferase component Bud32